MTEDISDFCNTFKDNEDAFSRAKTFFKDTRLQTTNVQLRVEATKRNIRFSVEDCNEGFLRVQSDCTYSSGYNKGGIQSYKDFRFIIDPTRGQISASDALKKREAHGDDDTFAFEFAEGDDVGVIEGGVEGGGPGGDIADDLPSETPPSSDELAGEGGPSGDLSGDSPRKWKFRGKGKFRGKKFGGKGRGRGRGGKGSFGGGSGGGSGGSPGGDFGSPDEDFGGDFEGGRGGSGGDSGSGGDGGNDSRNGGNTPGADTAPDQVAQQSLDAHNKVRAQHGAPPVVWSNSLASLAKRLTDRCAQDHGELDLNAAGFNSMAQNMAFGYRDVSQAIIDGWYGEIEEYRRGGNGVTGHMKAVLWKTTTHIGCSLNTNCGQANFVCNYGPHGGSESANLQI